MEHVLLLAWNFDLMTNDSFSPRKNSKQLKKTENKHQVRVFDWYEFELVFFDATNMQLDAIHSIIRTFGIIRDINLR